MILSMKTKRIIGALVSFAMIFSSLGALSASAENKEQFLAEDYDYITVTPPSTSTSALGVTSDNLYTLKITKPCILTADFVTYNNEQPKNNKVATQFPSLDYEICLGTNKYAWVSKTTLSYADDGGDSESLSYTVTMDDINNAGGVFTLYCGARVKNVQNGNSTIYSMNFIDYFERPYHFTLTAKQYLVKETKKVTGNFEPEDKKVFSIDIEWGSMNFTYKEPGKRVWDPDTFEYISSPVGGGWSCDEDANKITITNHSNAAVDAVISFEPFAEYSDIDGEFLMSGTSYGSKLDHRFETAEAYTVDDVQYPAGARSQDFYFSIKSGELPEDAVNAEFGEIKVNLKEA